MTWRKWRDENERWVLVGGKAGSWLQEMELLKGWWENIELTLSTTRTKMQETEVDAVSVGGPLKHGPFKHLLSSC